MSSFELEGDFQLCLRFSSLWASHRESVLFCSMQNRKYPDLLHEKHRELPFVSDVPQYGDGDVKLNYLVWQTKKYEWLNFMHLI